MTRRGMHYQTVPRHVQVMEHTGGESLAGMSEWVLELRARGLLEPRIDFRTLLDNGQPIGRLRIGTGADALITEGGHLVFRPNPAGGPGRLEVVEAERFYKEFQPQL
jgi:hypothetical protein